jgi:restriction system protein
MQHFNLEYHRENHLLFLSVELPHPDQFLSRQEFISDSGGKQQRVVTEYSPADRSEIYNEACYQYILKILHEIRALDEDDVVEAIKLQARVNHLNRGNGHMEKLCIATLYVSAADIEKINLAQVDPALCFRYLRGVSAPSLADLLPVPAPFAIAENDPEMPGMEAFLEPQDDAQNLASMQWADLEERLTDLFGREFGQMQGGLEILHSSPEQGLDAIGTDPDLLRGGKILFLARRSNKPLTVSIVRELFGLTFHEGAIKGILITTADFTPEAYAFAQHKPITLVNGNSLLSLFEKYGQRYRINLREAVSLASLLR